MIVDVNLKGVSHHTNGKEAMYIISKQLKHQLSNFDMESYGLIYQCTNKNCFQDESIGIMTVIITILQEICVKIEQVVTTIITRCIVFFFAVILFFMILLIILLLCVAYVLYEIIQPINTDLEKGDWNTSICYLNCISSVRPTNQTILMVPEVTESFLHLMQ